MGHRTFFYIPETTTINILQHWYWEKHVICAAWPLISTGKLLSLGVLTLVPKFDVLYFIVTMIVTKKGPWYVDGEKYRPLTVGNRAYVSCSV